jgi:predicted component of viral defense system (DUF524 family)
MMPLSTFSIRTTSGAELHITLDRSFHAELGTVVDLPLDGACGEEDRSFVPEGQIAPKLAFEVDESRWDVLEPLRLVENIEYTFSIIVPMPQADFERQSKRAGDGVFPFHNLKLKECITFNGPDSCRMIDRERCMVIGRLKFDNQLGGVDLSLREDIADLHLRAEVTSNKLDYEQDFQELLGQLAGLHAEIILNLDAPTELALRLSDQEPSIQMVLLHLRHFFHAQQLPLAVATIIGNPLSRRVARHALETTAFVTEPDWMQLQSTPSVLTWTTGGALASSFRGVTPETLPIRTIENSCDTIENRFVKYSLKQLQQLIQDVRDRVGKSYQVSRKRLAEWDALVDELLLHPLWRSVGECSVFPNSMVMYERHGYRDYMQGLMLLDLGLLIESDLGVIDRVTGDLKPIWALYEMWCYFELRTIVEKITGCPGEPTKAQLIRSKDFSTDLIAGKTGCTRFQAQRAMSTLEVNLYYNRSFELATSDSHDHWSGSYSTKFRPDFSIEITVGSHVHWVHFDAKYRVAFIPAKTQTGDPMTVRTFQSADVDRMHMYRDAILGTRGCYVLYPGNTNDETVFVRHPNAVYREQWPGPSVGAFPLCPSNDANQEEQRTRLENHLDRLNPFCSSLSCVVSIGRPLPL